MTKGKLLMLAVLFLFLSEDMVVFEELKINTLLILHDEEQTKSYFKKRYSGLYKKTSKKKNSKKEIKKLCEKAKLKIMSLDIKGKRKSTSAVRRCKKAYSDLRYQACHMKKYKERVVMAAKTCRD